MTGIVANRVQPLVEPLPIEEMAPESLRPAIRRAAQANVLARSQREVLAPLGAFSEAMITIGLRNNDVHTIAQLRQLAGEFATDAGASGTLFSVDTVLH